MRIPIAAVGIKIQASVDLANIFYLDQWGTQDEKRFYMSSQNTNTPIIIGPQIDLPLDMANIQDIAGQGFMTSNMAMSILSMIVVYKGLILPITKGDFSHKINKRNIPSQHIKNKKSRKKRSTLTNIIQEYISPWIIAGFENQPMLDEILAKMGVPKRKCQEQLVCQAYTNLPHLPHGIMDLVVVFSKHFVDLPEYELAMVYGLGGGCDSLHPDMPHGYCLDPVDLVNLTNFWRIQLSW